MTLSLPRLQEQSRSQRELNLMNALYHVFQLQNKCVTYNCVPVHVHNYYMHVCVYENQTMSLLQVGEEEESKTFIELESIESQVFTCVQGYTRVITNTFCITHCCS